jgi:hypothetical protein
MKNFLLLSFVFSMLCIQSFAQTSVQFNINHKLASEEFATETNAVNSMGHDFYITRLQYYISKISLTHDGGTETEINDFWILVDAGEDTQVSLGSYEISSLEKIKFHIGVEPAYNHLDPSTYQSAHPLAPKFPSMHWGWTAGYRFVALEGKSGDNFSQTIQLHGLGDDNYFSVEIPIDAVADSNDELTINIDADYTRALENIAVYPGVLVHGEFFEAKQCLENFRDYVFSPSNITSAATDKSGINKFEVFPNPSVGTVNVLFETDERGLYDLTVTNLLGKQIIFRRDVDQHTATEVQLEEAGFYLVSLLSEGKTIITKKLIVK